jgi:hypothetical protein
MEGQSSQSRLTMGDRQTSEFRRQPRGALLRMFNTIAPTSGREWPHDPQLEHGFDSVVHRESFPYCLPLEIPAMGRSFIARGVSRERSGADRTRQNTQDHAPLLLPQCFHGGNDDRGVFDLAAFSGCGGRI